jgi:hypothetical protein
LTTVDDPPARQELRGSVTRGEDGTPPRRPSEEGTQTDFRQFRI